MNIRCPQCDASLEVGTEHILTKCPYCGVHLLYSKDGFLTLERVKPTHDSSVAKGLLKNLVGKNLRVNMEYFPFYRIEAGGMTYFIPGKKVDLYGINSYIPAGDRITLDFDVEEPEISADTALSEAELEEANSIGIIYHPFYIARDSGTIYYVDAATGAILSNKLLGRKKVYSNKHPLAILNWLTVSVIVMLPINVILKIIVAISITAGLWYFESVRGNA